MLGEYETERVTVFNGCAKPEELEKIINKKIKRIENVGDNFSIYLDDGSILEIKSKDIVKIKLWGKNGF